MVKIIPFHVEEVSGSDNQKSLASISLDQLQELSEVNNIPLLSHSMKMTYGEIRGLKDLRVNLANLYSSKAGKRWDYYYYVNCVGTHHTKRLLFRQTTFWSHQAPLWRIT